MRVLPTGAVMAHAPDIRTQCHSVVNCQAAAISADMRGCTHVSCGVRTHAQLPAVDLKPTPLATLATDDASRFWDFGNIRIGMMRATCVCVCVCQFADVVAARAVPLRRGHLPARPSSCAC